VGHRHRAVHLFTVTVRRILRRRDPAHRIAPTFTTSCCGVACRRARGHAALGRDVALAAIGSLAGAGVPQTWLFATTAVPSPISGCSVPGPVIKRRRTARVSSAVRRLSLLVIGDLQGCDDSLQKLLQSLPRPIGCCSLRLVKPRRIAGGAAARAWVRRSGADLLGNHDLHLSRSPPASDRNTRTTPCKRSWTRPMRRAADWLRMRRWRISNRERCSCTPESSPLVGCALARAGARSRAAIERTELPPLSCHDVMGISRALERIADRRRPPALRPERLDARSLRQRG